VLDREYAKAVDPLNRAKPQAGDLGDYVSYYLGSAYFQAGRTAEAVSTLGEFDRAYPESLLQRDAHAVYSDALLAEGRPQDAITLLEKDRQPPRADFELTLGRAYAAAGQPAKAAEILRNLYVTMPLSPEASQADVELKKLASATPLPSLGPDGRRTRADLLAKGKRFGEAADEYRALLNVATPNDRPDVELALAVALRRSGQNKEAKKVLEELTASTPEITAQRLFNLGEVARATDDDDGFLRNLV